MPVLHFDVGGFSDFNKRAAEINTGTIFQAYAEMEVNAVNVASYDLGSEPADLNVILERKSFPLISANVVRQADERPFFPTHSNIKIGELDVGVVGVTDILGGPWTTPDGAGLKIIDPAAAAAPIVAELDRNMDLVILLAHVQTRSLPALVKKLPGVDLILGGDGFTSSYKEMRFDNVVAGYSGYQGKNVGLLRVWLGRRGGIAKYEHEIVNLARKLPEDKKIAALVAGAEKEIRGFEEAERLKVLSAINEEYIGFRSCRECHREAYDKWRSTKHYTAFNPLIDARKVEDDQCLRCHTTGHGDGGFVNLRDTPDMVTVQCEACHGPGRSHTQSPKSARMPGGADESVCLRCHDRLNSPNFDFGSYWGKIRH